MNSLSKLAGFLTAAVMLAAFAMPASAAKVISLSVNAAGLPTSVDATIINNANGNSSANSYRVVWSFPNTVSGDADNNFKVTEAKAFRGAVQVGAVTCQYSARTGQCTFNNQPPLKPGDTVTIKLTATIINECIAFSLKWSAQAWTGSPDQPSTLFTQTNTVPLTEWQATDCIACGDTKTAENAPPGASAIVTRVEDEECVAVPYTFVWRNGAGVLFEKVGNQHVISNVKIVWPLEDAAGINALSKQRFAGDNFDTDIDLCQGTATYDYPVSGSNEPALPNGKVLTGLDDIPTPPAVMVDGGLQYGCYYFKELHLPEGPIAVPPMGGSIEYIRLEGDWGASRN